jgi:adenylosuccinate synthase
MRTAPLVTDHLALDRFVAGRIDIQDFLQCGGSVLIEGTQGYGLGQHAGHYPYVTSSDCTAIDFLAMAGVSPWLVMPKELAVWVVFRAYPIRVAGNSGPLYAETTWADLGLPEEKTTVTNRLRRVGHWNPVLARSAMEANGWPAPAVKVAFTMADHLLPELAGHTSLNDVSQETKLGLAKLLETTEHDLGAQISLLGTGPASVIDLASLRSESTP